MCPWLGGTCNFEVGEGFGRRSLALGNNSDFFEEQTPPDHPSPEGLIKLPCRLHCTNTRVQFSASQVGPLLKLLANFTYSRSTSQALAMVGRESMYCSKSLVSLFSDFLLSSTTLTGPARIGAVWGSLIMHHKANQRECLPLALARTVTVLVYM